MAIDWEVVGENVLQAVQGVIGNAWNQVEPTAGPQMAALVQVGQDIEQRATANPPTITKDAYDFLKANQQRALDTVLQTYEAIGYAVALQAAAAAWDVVEKALVAALPFAIP